MDNVKNTADKRGAKGGGTTRQRPDGRWEGRCTINGKRRSFYGEKQADVLKAMREAQKAVDDHTYCDPKRMTFGEWLDIWLEEYSKAHTKQSTYLTRKMYIKNRIKPAVGAIKLQELNTTHLQTFYNRMLNNEHLATETVKNALHNSIITASLNQAVKLKYIPINPAIMCALPRRVKKEFSPFSEREVVAFLNEIRENEPSPYKELFEVALFTGMRAGEICGMTWDEVDFKKESITIKQQLTTTCIGNSRANTYIETPKNGKTRVIFPAKDVMDILKRIRRMQLENQLAAGAAWKNEKGFVFTNKIGDFLLYKNVYYRFKKVVACIGKPEMRFHDLRHTYTILSLRAGDDPRTVQQNLGHATAAFTLEVYAHVTEDMKKESADRMQTYREKIQA